MYLKSLRLTDFAGIRSAELPLIEPGLNIIVGDNEAGKSTLLTALRAAFFQKHRAGGEAVKALGPYGRQARPEVEVGFEIDGTSYTLTKAFLQRPAAELVWAGGTAVGRRGGGASCRAVPLHPSGRGRTETRQAPGRLRPVVGRAGAVERRPRRRCRAGTR